MIVAGCSGITYNNIEYNEPMGQETEMGSDRQKGPGQKKEGDQSWIQLC